MSLRDSVGEMVRTTMHVPSPPEMDRAGSHRYTNELWTAASAKWGNIPTVLQKFENRHVLYGRRVQQT